MPISSHRILFEDDHLLAVDKLSKELVVKGKGKVGKLPLLDLLQQDFPGLRAVHRLDFETSGVVVFAKTKEAYESIRESNFADWKKVYSTLVMGRIERKGGTIRKKLSSRVTLRRAQGDTQLVDAISHYSVIDRFANSSFVEVEIETGRHHQIRRHFAAIQHPLVLDHVYGHKKFNNIFTQEFGYKMFFLHASKLEFPHPVTAELITIESPLPKPFAGIIKRLRSL